MRIGSFRRFRMEPARCPPPHVLLEPDPRPLTALKAFAEGRLFGTRYGTGDPWLLALHGWRRTNADYLAVLGGGPGSEAGPLDAIALDLPGFGSAPPPPAPWGSSDYAAALAPVLAEMRKPVVVMGHSFGGRVALSLAASRPEEVCALVLSGVPLRRPAGARRKPAPAFRLARALHRVGLVGDERMERLRYRYGSADYRAATGVMRQVLVRVLGEDYGSQLSLLRCPVELVWGDDDAEAPIGIALALESEIASAHLTVCPGAGHLTPLTAPGALRSAALRHRP